MLLVCSRLEPIGSEIGTVMKNKKVSKEEEYRLTLLSISNMGVGIKEDIIDWQNIGKGAVHKARQVLAKKCPKCGKVE